MYLWHIALPKAFHDGFRRQHRYHEILGPGALSRVAFRRPEQQGVAPYQVRAFLNPHEGAIWQRAQRSLIRDLFPSIDSCGVEFQIHFVSEGRPSLFVSALPGDPKGLVALSPAL